VDQATNRLSLFNVLETVQAPRFPMLVLKCMAVALWRRDAGDEERDFQSMLRITLPGGAVHQIETNFRIRRTRHRIVNRLSGLPIPEAGDVHFELLLNGQHAASHIINAELQPAAQAQPPQQLEH
jgi:hypothetical protein